MPVVRGPPFGVRMVFSAVCCCGQVCQANSRIIWAKCKQGCGSSDRFRNQPQLPFILFTTLNTARDFPTQNDSEFIIVSLTGRPHYKSRVVFRTEFSENHGHDAGIADFFLLVSCFSMLPLIFLMSFV